MSQDIKILIDAKKILDGGIGVYIQNLVSGLLQYENIDITLIGDSKKIQKFDWAKSVKIIQDDAKSYSLAETFSVRKKIDFSKYDLFHVPHWTLPLGINIPTVVTVHDTIHITHPRKFYYPMVAKAWIGSSLKRATQVITVSTASKNDLIEYFDYARQNRDKINVVPNSIASIDAIDVSNKEREFKFEYFLSIFSTTMPHKGLEDLLFAYHKLEVENKNQGLPKLVIAGFGIQELLDSGKIKNFMMSENVIVLGSLTSERKKSLIKNAKAMIIPSLAEGFCFQALDAQVLGIPFISRPVPAILELATRNDFCAKSMSKEDLFNILNDFCVLTKERNLNYSYDATHFEKFKNKNVTEEILKVYEKAIGKDIDFEIKEERKYKSAI